ncbi:MULTISPECIES: DUF2630 family protein [unclassified Arthrobacter]|uniref:DUF2630 family protein n=1 Tax=unclassified Arthrobacter TaxID=235627 RepID=UPI0021031782|nr:MULTISPECIES: DUF2630 family protein [unclassified Arthrobacter]MCQ1946351.1 DUF2630 family protein [Arthrobacter sp. zg-Y1116]MCQ1986292.1 DUF2630 family protein [Arthrobacter sp. zg-Y844]MCQ1993969.1 DUF2630 family protein [Arthrobacter sp. zg-Y1171]UWX81916.1 DUF2630 family protein [Arthrobacter sp. zg-Y1171]
MDEQEIQHRIQELVAQEQSLRETDPGAEPEKHAAELRRVEEQLDQYWDLLRQRRAKADAGQNPDEAQERPVGEVEGYRQ